MNYKLSFAALIAVFFYYAGQGTGNYWVTI